MGWVGTLICKLVQIALRKSNNDRIYFVLLKFLINLYLRNISVYNSSIACRCISVDVSPQLACILNIMSL